MMFSSSSTSSRVLGAAADALGEASCLSVVSMPGHHEATSVVIGRFQGGLMLFACFLRRNDSVWNRTGRAFRIDRVPTVSRCRESSLLGEEGSWLTRMLRS